MLSRVPGAKKDKFVVNLIPLFKDLRTQNRSSVKSKVNIDDTVIHRLYNIANENYPRCHIFANRHHNWKSSKEKLWAEASASARKSLEKLLVVIFAQIEVLAFPARLGDPMEFNDVFLAGLNFHKMIVEKIGYNCTARFRTGTGEIQTAPIVCRRL